MPRWVNLEKRRYYKALVVPDLFGDLSLVRAWGSLDSRLGNVAVQHLESDQEATTALQSIAKRRKQRGYVLAERDR